LEVDGSEHGCRWLVERSEVTVSLAARLDADSTVADNGLANGPIELDHRTVHGGSVTEPKSRA
jgi:hypothetical protein